MAWRSLARARGTIHDVNTTLSRATDRSFLLSVSERTLYLLHNLASLDVGFRARYSLEAAKGLYRSLEEQDPEYEAITDAIEAFQVEVIPLMLQEIAGTNQGPELAQLVCCPETVVEDTTTTDVEPDVGDPPSPFATWDDWRDALCLEAQVYVKQLESAMARLNAAVGAGSVITLALLAIVLAPLTAGASLGTFALLVLVQLLPAVVGMFNAGLYTGLVEEFEALRQDIVCDIYNSTSVEEARTAIHATIDAGIGAGLVKETLKALFTRGGLSNVYDMQIADLPGFTPDPDYCDACAEVVPGVHYITAFVSYEVLSGTASHITIANATNMLGAPDGQHAVITLNNNTQDHRWRITADFGQVFNFPGTSGRIVFTGRNTGTNPINHSICRREPRVWVSGDGATWQQIGGFRNPLLRVGPDDVTCAWDTDMVSLSHFPFRYVRWDAIDRTVPGDPPPNGTQYRLDAVAYYEDKAAAPPDC